MRVQELLDRKESNDIFSVTPEASVFEAVTDMVARNVGAMLVMREGSLVGIITERDYLRLVTVQGRTARDTPVHEVMTRTVIYLTPDVTVDQAMNIMTEKRIRHLPVLEKDRVIDKFWGMRYPAGREHNLFFVCWMEGVRFALRHGARQYQSGQTAYAQKVKLGSRLDPMWVYFRHRWPLVNRVFRRAAPLVAFDRMDPELADIRKRAKGA